MKEVRAVATVSIPMPKVDPNATVAEKLDAAIQVAEYSPYAEYVVAVTTETIEVENGGDSGS